MMNRTHIRPSYRNYDGDPVRWLLAALPLLTHLAAILSLVLSPVMFGVPDPIEVSGLGAPAVGAGIVLTVLGLFLERREGRASVSA